MNRYKRRHGQTNTSKGIYWILFAGAIALIIYKVIEFNRKVKQAQEMEKQEKEYKIPDPGQRVE